MYMKLLFIIANAILLCSCNNDQNVSDRVTSKSKIDEECPILSFQENEVDLGILNLGEKIYANTFFEFYNSGEKPLVIREVDVSCGCIKVEYTKSPITKGKSGKIKVVLDLNKITGYFHKKISVISNAENDYEVLSIKGKVIK